MSKVYVDIQAIRSADSVDGQRWAFAPNAIGSLASIARRVQIELIADEDEVLSSSEELSLLAGEGVRFGNVISRKTFEDSLDREHSDRVFVVAGNTLSGRIDQGKDATVIEPLVVGWDVVPTRISLPDRTASVVRQTSETSIEVMLNLDGRGVADISTGVGFFDHMLEQIARHSRMDIRLRAQGDLHIDEHHTVEDVAIVFGEAFAKALGDKRGIERYSFVLPMDEALATVALDLSGRSWLVWDVDFKREMIGDMPTEMFKHFFQSFTDAGRVTLNVVCSGENEHHKIESIFKAFGRCLGQSVTRRAGDIEVPSTKGQL